MFQTWLDLNKQIVRKVIDNATGALTAFLIGKGEAWALWVPAVMAAGNFLWFWIDNRGKVTVQGLKAGGEASVATEVKAALEAKK